MLPHPPRNGDFPEIAKVRAYAFSIVKGKGFAMTNNKNL